MKGGMMAVMTGACHDRGHMPGGALAAKAEKRVKQQEEQLEETVRKFEDFLKDNDMKAVEAMKKAEHEAASVLDPSFFI